MKHMTGDLISLAETGVFNVIVHGCNCFCTMGSGIAKQIRARYSAAYEADLATVKSDATKLGRYTYAYVMGKEGHQFYIINGYTQFHYGKGGPHVNYTAVRAVFRDIGINFCHGSIGFPLIGAGLGGGDWTEISKIIDEELGGRSCDYTLVTLS